VKEAGKERRNFPLVTSKNGIRLRLQKTGSGTLGDSFPSFQTIATIFWM